MINKLKNIEDSVKFQHSRLFRVLNNSQINIHNTINNYLTDYCKYYKILHEEVRDRYLSFVKRYANDLKRFELTGKFPYQFVEEKAFSVDRITYDLFLIITPLITLHRFNIMEYIFRSNFNAKNCLIVGVGSGIDLELIKGKFLNIEAYDLGISDFVKERFQGIQLKEGHYKSSDVKKFDVIFAIEILEHLSDPYSLIKLLKESLSSSGNLVITTIKDIPQFDHYYNFTDYENFENELQSMGLEILQKKDIKHNYRFNKVDASNTLYNLRNDCFGAKKNSRT